MNKKQTTPILLICTSFLTFPIILTLIKSIKNDYLLISVKNYIRIYCIYIDNNGGS